MACAKARTTIRQNADALVAFGVAGLAGLGFLVLLRKPHDESQV